METFANVGKQGLGLGIAVGRSRYQRLSKSEEMGGTNVGSTRREEGRKCTRALQDERALTG